MARERTGAFDSPRAPRTLSLQVREEQMPLKKAGGPFVGLDIGTNFIKACEIDIRGGRANLRGIAVIPTPPESVSNNEIVDPVALGKAIKQVLTQNGIKAKSAVTCVTGQS